MTITTCGGNVSYYDENNIYKAKFIDMIHHLNCIVFEKSGLKLIENYVFYDTHGHTPEDVRK